MMRKAENDAVKSVGLAWAVAIIAGCFILGGCGSTMKGGNKYTINQGVPSTTPSAAPSIPVQPKSSTELPNLSSSGSGNIVIIIEESDQDSEADGAVSTQGSNAATEGMRAAAAKLVNDLRRTNTDNPQTTTTTTNPTTPITDPVDPADPNVPVEPIPGQGEFEELE